MGLTKVYNPITWWAEAGESPMNSRLAWSTNQVPEQPEMLHKETLSHNNNNNNSSCSNNKK